MAGAAIPAPIMRLLFVTSNRLGDAILSTGILGELINENPGVRVTIVAGPAAAPLFDAVPGLDRVIAIEKKRWHGHWFSLWTMLAGTNWDIAVDLRRSVLLPIIRAKTKLTAHKPKGLVHRVALLGATIGKPNDPPPPRLWWRREHDRLANAHLDGRAGGVLAIGPTANWQGKIWPADRFVDMAIELTGPDGPLPGARIAVFGAPGEHDQAAAILSGLPAGHCIDLVGKLDLPVVAATLSRCALYVGNDSGLMHMAAATGIPTLGLFGPSLTELYAPWGDNAAFIRTPESFEELIGAPDYNRHTVGSLMTGLTVDAVISAARALLDRTSSLAP